MGTGHAAKLVTEVAAQQPSASYLSIQLASQPTSGPSTPTHPPTTSPPWVYLVDSVSQGIFAAPVLIPAAAAGAEAVVLWAGSGRAGAGVIVGRAGSSAPSQASKAEQ